MSYDTAIPVAVPDDVNRREAASVVTERLRSTITKLLDPLISGAPHALVDFPDHANVGDSAIWLGEIAYFRTKGINPAYVCAKDSVDWQALAAAVPDGPIFIHGGGNFGDLWPEHQDFRIEILRRFPGRLVVQLPQSIHFSNDDNIAPTRAAISAHGNFVLLVRDRPSFDMASSHFDCQLSLCPDMAFCLGPIVRPVKPVHDELNLLRTDLERNDAARVNAIKPHSVTADWLDEPRGLHARLRLSTRLLALASGRWRDKAAFDNEYFHALATHRTLRGLKLLSSARHVTTDRLHAHILSTLLDIPHTVLDNSYGKISRFMQAFGTGWCGVDVWQPPKGKV